MIKQLVNATKIFLMWDREVVNIMLAFPLKLKCVHAYIEEKMFSARARLLNGPKQPPSGATSRPGFLKPCEMSLTENKYVPKATGDR